MGKILSRIQEIASKEGITIGALERQIGASKGVLSRAITNGTDIQSKWIQVIVENYPRYSAYWLLTGKGNMMATESSTSQIFRGEILENPQKKEESGSVLLDIIREQAEEIGRLKEQNAQLRMRLSKDASIADTGATADAG